MASLVLIGGFVLLLMKWGEYPEAKTAAAGSAKGKRPKPRKVEDDEDDEDDDGW